MDKQTRNLIQKATQDARNLLESEFGEQLEGVFDILPNGRIAPEPGKHLNPGQCIIRKKLIAAIEHEKAGGVSDAEAVANYLREASFTCLNRFAALKMLEARGLVQECVSRGEQSSGFKEFCGLAPGLLELPDKGYRLYIESLFDELSTEIRVLFDRRDLASLLWPGRKAFDGLLDILNREEIAGVWGEDETIGWVYQYFNSGEERKKMRDASAAPRNSRELAVRNQFFTPRYVVEFLTDNTLGRIWYEMRQGDTVLKDECRYLVRRPNEIFLGPGEKAPVEDDGDTDLSQEELLKKTVYIEHRAKKDPRDIKILDPACGSGHFLLYAFDLLERIYEESWGDKELPQPEATGRMLREDYQTLENLQNDIPKLIIEHNLHGIDIDHRAVQIAALSLWMRAQRSWKRLNLNSHERPQIKKSNVVTAEPMPGEEDMRREFTAGLKPRVLGQLVDEIFEKMKLAGEAGALLKIEKEIKEAVAEGKRQWLEVPEPEQQSLFPSMTAPKPRQLELRFDVKSVTEEDFWDQAEERVTNALKDYAERAENGHLVRRRLFSEDAAHGFAFIDLCRKRYDVVLMNPPFGDLTARSQEYVSARYPQWSRNVLCAFTERAVKMTGAHVAKGLVGAVCDRTVNVKSTYEPFRRSVLLGASSILHVIDLGWGVLDANVEVSAWTLGSRANARLLFGFDLRESEDKNLVLREEIHRPMIKTTRNVLRLPNAVIGYYFPDFVTRMFGTNLSLAEAGFDFFEGHTLKSERYFRYYWELLPGTVVEPNTRWVRLFNGTPYSRFYYPLCEVVPYGVNGRIVVADSGTVFRNQKKHFVSGVCFGKRGEFLDSQVLPHGFVSTVEGKACAEPKRFRADILLAILNSSLFQYVINLYCGQHKYSGYVGLFPFAGEERLARAAELARKIVELKSSCFSSAEFSPLFTGYGGSLQELDSLISELKSSGEKLRVMSEDLEQTIFDAYGLKENDIATVERFCSRRPSEDILSAVLGLDVESNMNAKPVLRHWLLGVAFGRAVPNWVPGESSGDEGYPATVPNLVAGAISRAIIVDDPGHHDDLIKSIGEAAGEKSLGMLEDYCAERSWFRRDCFQHHLSVFSAGKRPAPIYWQLSTPSASYSVWLYYHRFTKDTFYKVLNEFVTPKLQFEERELTSARRQYGASPTATQRKEIAARETFVAELKTFKEEVARIAPVWNPNLNDGVIINFAPLWRLVPQNKSWQKECKKVWDKLVKGDYDWAHLAMHLWPERVVPKCTTDRSLAIAHELDEILWEEDEKGKRNPKDISRETLENLIQERTSITVKAALEDLLNAPVPTGATRKKRKRKT